MGKKAKRKGPRKMQAATKRKGLERRKSGKRQSAPALSISAPGTPATQIRQETLPSDHDLLERARAQWLCGDWESLSRIDVDSVQHHPDRANVILLAAVAQQRMGDAQKAATFARLAKEWGCNRSFMSRVLIGNAYETLGRASLAAGSMPRAQRHFVAALGLATPGTDSSLLAQSRMAVQLRDQNALLDLRQAKLRMQGPEGGDGSADGVSGSYETNPRFAADPYEFYRSLAMSEEPRRFLLVDSKSLPRAGLHYLKNTLSRLLPDQFSFCEWYQEPGCCKKMPCALKAYAEAAQRSERWKIRLVKSHDFLLDDPDFPVLPNVQRLILIRDPIFILTSWFELEEFNRYSEALRHNAIDMKKLWLYHEPELTNFATRIIDEIYEPRSEAAIIDWLVEKSRFIAAFLEKWAYPAIQEPDLGWRVVSYERINGYVAALVNTFGEQMDDAGAAELNRKMETERARFKPRMDPFKLKSNAISADIRRRAKLFREAAETVTESEKFRALVHRLVVTRPEEG